MPSATSDRKWNPDYRIAVPGKLLEPQEILAALQEAAGGAWIGGRTAGWTERAKAAAEAPAPTEGAEEAAPAAEAPAPAPEFRQVWVDVEREGLRPAVQKLIAIHFPHFVVIAAEDRGEEIVLPYVFRLYHGKRHAEVMVTVSVHLPKAEPTVPSICDLIPGVLISEREKQEMMGVVVEGIPDGRRMFLPDDFPEGVYPWRKDETAPKEPMVRELWSAGRPGGEG
jgi:Ni,Fe-hydrogenase III component G